MAGKQHAVLHGRAIRQRCEEERSRPKREASRELNRTAELNRTPGTCTTYIHTSTAQIAAKPKANMNATARRRASQGSYRGYLSRWGAAWPTPTRRLGPSAGTRTDETELAAYCCKGTGTKIRAVPSIACLYPTRPRPTGPRGSSRGLDRASYQGSW